MIVMNRKHSSWQAHLFLSTRITGWASARLSRSLPLGLGMLLEELKTSVKERLMEVVVLTEREKARSLSRSSLEYVSVVVPG